MQIRPKYFSIRELVPSEFFLKTHGESRCWRLFDDRLLVSIDTVRERHGPTRVNDWSIGRCQSGLRVHNVPTVGNIWSQTSQHAYGRAADCIFEPGTSVREIQQDIIDNPDIFPYVRGLEQSVSNWLHIDTRPSSDLVIF